MKPAADQQIVAQSRSNLMHSAIFLTSSSLKHADAQFSHSWAQRIQASMHDWNCSRGIWRIPFRVTEIALDRRSGFAAMHVPAGEVAAEFPPSCALCFRDLSIRRPIHL